jgi:uncharacterized protein involved in response to NO
MLFGFGWAIMAGFLLTASKNWVKIRGMHGQTLAIAVALWIFERFSFFFESSPLVLIFTSSVSVVFVVVYILSSLLRHRKNDTFQDNWLFIIGLPIFVIAKVLILAPLTFQLGWSMGIGFFRLAFLIMLERTTIQFMKTNLKITIEINTVLDMSIKLLALTAILEHAFPSAMSSFVLAALAGLIIIRLATWHPANGLSTFGIAVMYIGHGAIALHLILQVLSQTSVVFFVGNVSLHAFSFLTMGTIIPAMLIRISQGHTGRPIKFTFTDRAAISIMWLGAFLRLIAPQFAPSHYRSLIVSAAVCWFLCFSIIGFRIVPFLFKPRIDGREH